MAGKHVVVIGAGMGGLITAALLAKFEQMEVLVLEKESEIGGRTLSYGGPHGRFSEKEFRRLLMGGSGVRVVRTFPALADIINEHELFDTYVIDSGWHGMSAGNRSRYSLLAKALGKSLPVAPQVGLMYWVDGEWQELTETVKEWSREELKDRARVASLRLAISGAESARLDHIDLKSWLESITPYQRVREYYGTLARFQSGINDIAAISTGDWIRVNNITSSTGAHLSHGGGMGDVAGGFKNICNVFAEVVRENGGEVRTNARVTEVLFEDGRASGVTVDQAPDRHREVIPADVVVSNLPMDDAHSVIPDDRLPSEWRERIARIQPLAGILGHVALREPLETAWPKAMFVVDSLPGPTVKGGIQPAFGFEQTTIIDPQRRLKGHGVLVQTWVGLWAGNPDERKDRELVKGLIDAQLEFFRRQYPRFDEILDWYIFVLASRLYGISTTPGLVGDRRFPAQHPLISNLFFTGDTTEQTDYGTSGAAHGAILCANAVSGRNFLTLLPEAMR